MSRNLQGYEDLLRRLKAIGETEPMMRLIQLDAIAEAHKAVPRKTGHLQRSIVPGAVSKDHARIEARTPYAASVEFGARPHLIVPKTKKVLAWGGERRLTGTLKSGSQATHFAKKVNHPGNKPEPYLIPGAKKAIKRAGLAGLIERWNRAA